jgi:transcriptional regulator with XRE-family HTH domain
MEATLNETIRLLLTRTGKRHADVADAVGITRGSMTLRLQGKSRWRLDDLQPVADAFGLTVCELISSYRAIPEDRLPPAKGGEGQTQT